MPSAADRAERDRGLAVERTTLAWERTALLFTTIAAVVLGAAARHDAPWMLAPAVALFACAAVLWNHARRRRAGAGRPGDPRVLARVAMAAAGAGAVAAAIVVVRPG